MMSISAREWVANSVAPWLGLGETSTRHHFRSYFHNWSFWAVQALILMATMLHWIMEYGNEAGWFDISNIYVIATFTFFFVPVTLASLKFGMAGAIPTALWLALLATPNIFIWHDGVDRLAEGAQFLTIIAFAIVVASRVDREVAERREARLQITRRRISEAKYRYLFEAAGEAILVFDRDGLIQEANVAAGRLFQVPPSEITDSHLDTLIGSGRTEQLIEAAADTRTARSDCCH